MNLWQLSLVFSASLVTSNQALAGVIVVDAAGGGDFTQIQPAINAALDNDTILVKPGNYSGTLYVDRPVTVIGDEGALPIVTGDCEVGLLSSGEVATLARLKVQNDAGPGLVVALLSGSVRVVECEFIGSNGTMNPGNLPASGAAVGSGVGAVSDNVAFVGCTIRGGNGVSVLGCAGNGWSGGAFGLAANGRVALYECVVEGGRGGTGGVSGGGGGPAIFSFSYDDTPSFLFAARSNLHGGVGGDTECAGSGCPGNGASGFHATSTFLGNPPQPEPIGWVFDLMVGGGAPGQAVNGPGSSECNPANPGPQYSGVLPFEFSVASIGFSIPAIAREGDFVTATFTGPPGARVYVNDRLTTTFEAVASWRGVLLAPFAPDGAPTREIKWGVIPASGELKRTYHVPQLPPGVEAQTRFLQAYRIGANGITLGTFRTLTILDSAF